MIMITLLMSLVIVGISEAKRLDRVVMGKTDSGQHRMVDYKDMSGKVFIDVAVIS